MATKKKEFLKKLTNKYRLIIVNDSTFEEKVSFRLSRMSVFTVVGTILLLFTIATIFLIAFTPLREYIPGYDSTALKRKTTKLIYELDSLKNIVHDNEQYAMSIKRALTGKIPTVHISKDSLLKSAEKYNKDTMQIATSDIELTFREEVEREDRYSIFEGIGKHTGILFFAPIKGEIIESYDYENNYYGIEIDVSTNHNPIKSVADGTVIFSEFTASLNYTIIIEHTQGFISVYKNVSSIHTKVGEIVKSGEVIASVNNTSNKPTHPFYFELWNNGYPVNPIKYIDFKNNEH